MNLMDVGGRTKIIRFDQSTRLSTRKVTFFTYLHAISLSEGLKIVYPSIKKLCAIFRQASYRNLDLALIVSAYSQLLDTISPILGKYLGIQSSTLASWTNKVKSSNGVVNP